MAMKILYTEFFDFFVFNYVFLLFHKIIKEEFIRFIFILWYLQGNDSLLIFVWHWISKIENCEDYIKKVLLILGTHEMEKLSTRLRNGIWYGKMFNK